jgi:hypothetical protein
MTVLAKGSMNLLDRTGISDESVASQLSPSEVVSTEAEEYTLLGAVTEQRLVKTYRSFIVWSNDL